MLWPDWRCQGFLLDPSPLVYGQLARMCLWGHPKCNPCEHRGWGELFSRFLSPHSLLMGTRPGFCSGTHGLYHGLLSQLIYIHPQKMGSWMVLSHRRISLGVIPGRNRAVRLSSSKLIGITSPAEIMDLQTSVCFTLKNYFSAWFTLRKGNELPQKWFPEVSFQRSDLWVVNEAWLINTDFPCGEINSFLFVLEQLALHFP